jgi:hypothetical protein
MHGCVEWSLTLRDEHKSQALENKALWKIFQLRRDKDEVSK